MKIIQALLLLTGIASAQAPLPFPQSFSNVLFDDFNRPDAAGAGTPKWGDNAIGKAATGQPYSVIGPGYADVAIADHRFVNNGAQTAYLFALAPSGRGPRLLFGSPAGPCSHL
jgi:hypothetical protein